MNNSKTILLLLIAQSLSFAFFSFAMKEKETSRITIIDENNKQNIAQYISSDEKHEIHIFGATPRLTRNEQFTTVLMNDLMQLANLQTKSPRMKGVNYNVKKYYQQLRTISTDIDTALAMLDTYDTFNLFFHIGIKQATLLSNITTLIGNVCTKNSPSSLVHLMLPCYFNDVKEYDKTTLYPFLQASALFFKEVYTKAFTNILSHSPSLMLPNVYVLIPLLNHFQSLIKSISIPDNSSHAPSTYKSMEKNAKDQSIIDTLDKAMMIPLSSCPASYTLINPTEKGVKVVADSLSKTYPEKTIDIKELCLQDASTLRKITSFIPYTLKRAKDYSTLWKQSIVINEALVRHCKELFEKSKGSHA